MSVTTTPPTSNVRSRRRDDGVSGFLFALPHLVIFATFLLAPIAYGFYISLHRWHVLARTHPLVGLGNYAAVLQDDLFWLSLRNTVYFVLLVVPLGNLASLGLALALASVRRFADFYKVAFYLPVVISIAVVAVLWRWLYNTEVGLLNLSIARGIEMLRGVGLPLPALEPIGWLRNPNWVMPSIALMTIWWTAGGNMVLYLAGLNNIPNDYYAAASIDGANGWQRFRHVTLPLLRPTLLFCFIISVVASFQIFGQSYALFTSIPGGSASGPGRSGLTLALYMYLQGFNQYEIGYGAAIAYLLFAISLVLTAVQFRLFSRGDDDGRATR